MILRRDIIVLDALTDGLVLFKKHFVHAILVVLLQIFGTYVQTFVIQITGWKSSIIGLPWLLFILLMNLSLIVAIKGSYEQKPIEIVDSIKKASTYFLTAIVCLVLALIADFYIALLMGIVVMMFSAIGLIIVYIFLALVGSLIFIFAFIQQGVVIANLKVSKALVYSFQIYIGNFYKFFAITIIFAIVSYYLGISMDQVELESLRSTIMFMKFVEYLLACIGLFITTAMFYQVSQPDVSFRTWE